MKLFLVLAIAVGAQAFPFFYPPSPDYVPNMSNSVEDYQQSYPPFQWMPPYFNNFNGYPSSSYFNGYPSSSESSSVEMPQFNDGPKMIFIPRAAINEFLQSQSPEGPQQESGPQFGQAEDITGPQTFEGPQEGPKSEEGPRQHDDPMDSHMPMHPALAQLLMERLQNDMSPEHESEHDEHSNQHEDPMDSHMPMHPALAQLLMERMQNDMSPDHEAEHDEQSNNEDDHLSHPMHILMLHADIPQAQVPVQEDEEHNEEPQQISQEQQNEPIISKPPPQPEYLRFLSPEQKAEFYSISNNKQLSRKEQREAFNEWSKKNGVEKEHLAYRKEIEKFFAELHHENRELIKTVAVTSEKLVAIIKNDDLNTIKRRNELAAVVSQLDEKTIAILKVIHPFVFHDLELMASEEAPQEQQVQPEFAPAPVQTRAQFLPIQYLFRQK